MTDIEYSLNAFPLGGFVSFPEVDMQKTDTRNTEDKNNTSKKEKSSLSNKGLRLIIGNSSENINNETINNKDKNTSTANDPDLLRNRTLLERLIVIIGGVVANFICALVLLIVAVSSVGELKTDEMPGVKVTTTI